MIITIHQPDFLPWLGFFDRWRKSDLYIILDDVQFIRRGWHHRDKIKTFDGPQWLTVPVEKKGRFEQQIREVKIDNHASWQKKMLNRIQHAYAKAPCFVEHFTKLAAIVNKPHRYLIDLNLDLLLFCADVLKIKTAYCLSSEIPGVTELKGTQRLLKLVQAKGGDQYLTGLGSKNYLKEALLIEKGIQVIWQHFDHPVYPQLYNGFDKNLSVLDYVMMVNEF